MCLRSIAGVLFDSARRFQASLLLRTTSSVCISVVIGFLAVWQHNKPQTKNKKKTPASLGYPPSVFNKNCTLKVLKWGMLVSARRSGTYVTIPQYPFNKTTLKATHTLHKTDAAGKMNT